ncbi:MAG: hypothetical protein ACREOG_05645 [Gemmatimonadaceae bacterium]
MSSLFDTTAIRDDAAHWDALAERIAANAARESTRSGFDWLARSRARWIAASLLLVAAVGFMMLERASAKTLSAEWARAFAPRDEIGKAIVLYEAPPAIGALLLGGKGGG